jgi:glutamate-1-semialdehyde 2,1-aminomutase
MDEPKKYLGTRSAEAFAEACSCLPGGVNSPVRAFGGVDVDPLFIESAKSAILTAMNTSTT